LNDLFPRSAKRWFLLSPILLLACFLLIYPYHRGLFVSYVLYIFEGPLYGAMIWLSLTFAIWALLLPFRSVSPEWLMTSGTGGLQAEGNNRKKVWTGLVRHPLLRQMAPFAVLLLPLSYLVSSWNAASPHSAMLTFLVWIIYAFVFLMAYDMDSLSRIILAAGIGLSGTFVVIFGFMNYFGDASLWGLIQYEGPGGTVSKIYAQAAEYGASGLRLTSVFQYANSYAAFLIGFFLLLMAVVTHARSVVAVALASLPVVPALLSFLLTQSRGAYLMLPVTSLLFMALIRTHRQLIFLVLSILAGLLAVLLYGPIFRIGLRAVQEGFEPSMPLHGWALLLPASTGFAIVAVLMKHFAAPRLENFVERRLRLRGQQLLLPLAGFIWGAVGAGLLLRGSGFLQWLPPALRERLETINLAQHSVLERWTFYKDIFKMIGEYPWLGAGGGAWATLYGRYQNNPYTSNDPHSFYLQYMLDTGIIGFVLFAVFVAVCLASVLRKAFRLRFEWDAATPAFLGILLGLAVHSAFDFNMNYMYLGVLFFLSLGAVASPVQSAERTGDDTVTALVTEQINGKRESAKPSGSKRARASVRRSKSYSPIADRIRKINFGIAATCFIATIALMIVSSNRLSAHNIFDIALREANRSEVNFEEFDAKLREAIQKVPGHPTYLAQRTALLIQLYESTRDPQLLQEAKTSLDRLLKAEPNRRDAIELHIRLSLAQDLREEALAIVESGLTMFPWDMSLYEQAFELHYALGAEAAQKGDDEAMRQHWEAILRWQDVIEARIAHLATLPEGQIQGKPFEMTQRMMDILMQVQKEV